VLSILSTTGRLVALKWAPLLAWFLAGYLVHYLVIEVAAFFGATSAIIGIAIMPLAVLARLISFIAMFFVLRDAMPAFQSLADRGETVETLTPRPRINEVLLVSILPFFAFYAAWKFLTDDTQQYAVAALAKYNPFDGGQAGRPLDIEVNPITIGIVIVAFAARYLLKRYAEKLPRWTSLIAVYLEALWVYLTVLLISTYTDQVGAWIDSRAAVTWYEHAKDDVLQFFAPLGWAWSGIEFVIGEVSGLVLLPIAWLAIAGVVYGRALSAAAAVRIPGAFQRLTGRVPTAIARRGRDIGNDFLDRWRPLANALVLIWRAGVVPIGAFVLLYVVLDAGRYWLTLAATRVIGPHDLGAWWSNFDTILLFVVQLLVEPLRIALIAATYNYALGQLEERREAAAADPATTPSADSAAAAR